MTIKEFILKVPMSLNLKNAERISKAAELMYDEEVNNKYSVFAKRTNESLDDRFDVFYKLIDDAEDKKQLEFVKNVLRYASLKHDGKEDMELKEEILKYNPEIFEIVEIENEVKGSIWN